MRLEFEPSVIAIPAADDEVGSANSRGELASFDSLLARGIEAAQAGERERARLLLSEAAEVEPGSESAWMWLASISDYPEELLALLNRVLDINPDNERAVEWRAATRSLLAKTFVQRAIAAYEEGSCETADQHLDDALAHDPCCKVAWFWRASWASTENEKLRFLERILEIDPRDEEAMAAAKSIVDARSHRVFRSAKTSAAGGDREKALELVDEFLRAIPDNAEAWVLRSHLCGNLDDKLFSLEKALAIDPENAAARSSFDFLHSTLVDENSSVQDGDGIEEPDGQPSACVDDGAEFGPADEHIRDSTCHVIDFSLTDRETQIDEGPGRPHDAPVELVSAADPYATILPIPVEQVGNDAIGQPIDEYEGVVAPAAGGSLCPFCCGVNENQSFECGECHASLTLADIDSLLHNPRVDLERVDRAVTEMEADWNLRDFNVNEMTALAVGHFNLANHEKGLRYLQEAVRLAPDDLILSVQANAIAIRLDEMSRQGKPYEAMPKGKSILIVDDSPTVRKLVSSKLEKSGHNVICAEDGVQALERIQESLPDLVLLDIAMPRMDGYEVCRQIRANPSARHIPVVMISGKDGFFDKVRGRMAGTTGYVTKPFGPETLMKALEIYLRPESEDNGSTP